MWAPPAWLITSASPSVAVLKRRSGRQIQPCRQGFRNGFPTSDADYRLSPENVSNPGEQTWARFEQENARIPAYQGHPHAVRGKTSQQDSVFVGIAHVTAQIEVPKRESHNRPIVSRHGDGLAPHKGRPLCSSPPSTQTLQPNRGDTMYPYSSTDEKVLCGVIRKL